MAKLVHLFLIAMVLTAMITSSEAGFGMFNKFKKFHLLKAKTLGLGAAKFGKLGLLGGLGLSKKLFLKPKLLKMKKLKFLALSSLCSPVQGALEDILKSVPDSFYTSTMDFIFNNA